MDDCKRFCVEFNKIWFSIYFEGEYKLDTYAMTVLTSGETLNPFVMARADVVVAFSSRYNILSFMKFQNNNNNNNKSEIIQIDQKMKNWLWVFTENGSKKKLF